MVIDIEKIILKLKSIILIAFSIVAIYLAYKLSSFYMPFILAYIISMAIEPLILKIKKKFDLKRKTCTLIILLLVFSLIIGIFCFVGIKLFSEATNFLNTGNYFIEEMSDFFYDKITLLEKWNFKTEVKDFIREKFYDILNIVSNKTTDFLKRIISFLGSIPEMAIYAVITIMATYFFASDKVYILDRMEHHFPKKWVSKFNIHITEILNSIGGYLKAELTLILISFFIVSIGIFILYYLKFDIKYPFLISLFIGFVDALPILGSGTILIPWAIFSGINGNLNLAIALISIYAISVTAKQVLEPKIVSKNLGIHPIFTLIAMYTGFKVLGVLGLFVGPIVLIMIKNIFSQSIEKGIVNSIKEM